MAKIIADERNCAARRAGQSSAPSWYAKDETDGQKHKGIKRQAFCQPWRPLTGCSGSTTSASMLLGLSSAEVLEARASTGTEVIVGRLVLGSGAVHESAEGRVNRQL